jgi:hypothetical protein
MFKYVCAYILCIYIFFYIYVHIFVYLMLVYEENDTNSLSIQICKWKEGIEFFSLGTNLILKIIEDLDMNPHSYAHLIFDKGAKNIQRRKDSLINKCCWEKWLSICKKLKLDPCLSPCTSINSKWIKDLNIRPDILKLLQEGAGNTLELTGIDKDFLKRTPATQQLRERMDKCDFIKLKSFCTTKEMVSKLKRPPTG